MPTGDLRRLQGAPVRGEDWTGTIGVRGTDVYVQLPDGSRHPVDVQGLRAGEAGGYHLPVNRAQLDERVIPVLAEEVVVDKREVPTGAVRVEKRISEHTETVEVPLRRQWVEVRRVVVNQEVDKEPLPREEEDTLIIPIVEEELVVSKRLILKEEIHLVRHVSTERTEQSVTLRSEHAEVTRLDADGRKVEDSKPAPPPVVTEKRRRL